MVRSAMLYGIETVPLTKRQKRKMEVMEIKMLRFAQGKTIRDKIKNEVIRTNMNVESLQSNLIGIHLR